MEPTMDKELRLALRIKERPVNRRIVKILLEKYNCDLLTLWKDSRANPEKYGDGMRKQIHRMF